MDALRRRRLRSRVALLAITALLWSQMLLALHADCLSPAMGALPSVATVEHGDCADVGDATDLVVCASHCGQGEASSDGSRIPPVPVLGPIVTVPMVEVLDLRPMCESGMPLPVHGSWHRPTLHPASVLLI